VDLFDTDAVGDPQHQHHDWEPGIAPSGLLWTIPIDDRFIEVHGKQGDRHFDGEARYHGEVKLEDYHDGLNAFGLLDPALPTLPAKVRFDVRWMGGGAAQTIRDTDYRFTGTYVPGPAEIRFEARNDHDKVVYRSDPGGQFNPTPAQGGAGPPAVGTEQNGVFFH
jgi:hypothetical protein